MSDLPLLGKFLYGYGFLLLAALVVYIPALRLSSYGMDPTFHGAVSAHRQDEKESKVSWRRATLYICGVVAILIISLVVVWLMLKLLGNWMVFFFLLITIVDAVIFVYFMEVDKRFEFLSRYPRLQKLTALLLIGVIGAGWLLFPSWITYNICGFVGVYIIIRQIGPVKMKYLMAWLVIIILYDVWGVFGSGLIREIGMNQSFLVPLVIVVPGNILSLELDPLLILGLGDLVTSGVAVLTAKKYHLQWWVFGGFAVGLFGALLMAFVLRVGVPAMLTISPALLLSLFVGVRIKKTKLVWNA